MIMLRKLGKRIFSRPSNTVALDYMTRSLNTFDCDIVNVGTMHYGIEA